MAKKWEGKLAELTLVNAEVDRELASFVQRQSNMQNRATILVGAASVVGAIQISDGFAPLNIANLLLSFAAAVLGVFIAFPRTGDAPNPEQMQRAILNGAPAAKALNRMIRAKLETLEEDEDSLKHQGRVAKAGFTLLALSILVAGIGATVSTVLPAPAAETVEVVDD